MFSSTMRRVSGAFTASVGAALLTGCFMVPGEFESEMQLSADGSFTFSYDGEIHLLGLAQLAEMQNAGSEEMDEPCYDYGDETELSPSIDAQVDGDETTVPETATEYEYREPTERECTAEELAERREAAEMRAERDREQAREMSAMFGGVDPTDPDAGNELAAKLERQYGWEQVSYIGDGKFDVEYEISSRLSHDFAFPMMEGMSTASPFVYAYRRDNSVRIEAPGFAVGGGMASSGMGGRNVGLLAMMFGMGGGNDSEQEEFQKMFEMMRGTFTIITDGQILANNTEDGFTQMADGRRSMVWTVDPRREAPPTALIGM